MPYIIDGHNLVPKIPGLTLSALDDEKQLIEMLQEFCRNQHKRVEVFFDNAPPGATRARNFGLVVARFSRQGASADNAIRQRVNRLGGAARNWTVVSSDHAVQAAARAAQAHVISSEEFARLMKQTLDDTDKDKGEKPDAVLNSEDMDEWLQLFGSDEGGT